MKNNESNFVSDSAGKLGMRHLQTFYLFLGMAITHGLRVCMSVAIVAMTDSRTANPNIQVQHLKKYEK